MSKKALGKGLNSIFEDLGTPILSDSGDLIHNIPIAEIKPNPFQPRNIFDSEEIAGLSKSIAEKGLLQPIIVRKHQDHFQIIAGERRFRATQNLGLKSIKAFIRDKVSDQDMMELSLIENIQRIQLNPIEEAEGLKKLVEVCGLTHEELSERLQKSRSGITNTLRLLKLHPEAKNLLATGSLTAGHGRALLKLPYNLQAEAAQRILTEGYNVRAAESLSKKPDKPATVSRPVDPNLQSLLERAKYQVGGKVTLAGNTKKGRLIFHYHSQAELEHIFDLLEAGAKQSQPIV